MGATVRDDLLASAASRPDHLAVADRTQRLTYAELLASAGELANSLVGGGVRRGDRVVVLAQTGVECAVAVYAVALCGGCFVVLDPTTPRERLVGALRATGATAVVADAARSERARLAGDQLLPRPVVLASVPARLESTAVPAWSGRAGTPLSTDLAAVIYTSGSTGEPRGAAFLHRNLSFVLDGLLAYLPMTASDRTLSVLPLSHTYGLYQLLLSVRLGATLHLRPRAGLVGTLLQDVRDEEVTVLPGVPALWQLLCTDDDAYPFTDVRVLTNAGAALPLERVAALVRLFPAAVLYAMYGQTECARVSYLPPELLATKPESVGVPLPGTDTWLEDASGQEPAVGEPGELLVRGEHVMQGYWGDPGATVGKLVQGRWPGDRVLRTGDLFRRDDEGLLYFVARRDEMIVCGGEKIAPTEVERVLCTAPGVLEAAALGAGHPVLGQVVVAHVAGRGVDAQAVRRHCHEHLEAAKVPRLVHVHAQLPRLGNGKVDVVRLRAVESGVQDVTASTTTEEDRPAAAQRQKSPA